jgi:hypothetical protein
MKNQSDSKMSILLNKFCKTSKIYPENTPETILIVSEIIPNQFPEIINAETKISLPVDLKELWIKSNGLRIFEDKTYRQSGLVIWSLEEALKNQDKIKKDRHDFRTGDLIIGEFLGDSDLLVIRCDSDCSDFGQIVIALPIDHRSDWYLLPYQLSDFLQEFIDSQLTTGH